MAEKEKAKALKDYANKLVSLLPGETGILDSLNDMASANNLGTNMRELISILANEKKSLDTLKTYVDSEKFRIDYAIK